MGIRVLDLGGFGNGNIPFKTSTFPGGESFIRLDKFFSEKDSVIPYVEIYARLNTSHDIMQLVMAVGALREMGITGIEAIIPYIPYGRQDRVCNEGEAFSLNEFSKIINLLNLNKIYTYDAHSEVTSLKINNLVDRGNTGFVQHVFHRLVYNLAIKEFNWISPDDGASKKLGKSLKDAYPKPEIFQCHKERNLEDTTIKRMILPKITNDNPCLVVDDLIDGAATFINLVELFRKEGVKNDFYLAATHGILSKGIDILRPHYKHVFVTNSRNSNYQNLQDEETSKFITQLSLF